MKELFNLLNEATERVHPESDFTKLFLEHEAAQQTATVAAAE